MLFCIMKIKLFINWINTISIHIKIKINILKPLHFHHLLLLFKFILHTGSVDSVRVIRVGYSTVYYSTTVI